jgi:catechol 2,3-dioxygenase-like lactoylglutathione lyase family enzyme
MVTVRYIVKDVDTAVDFYTHCLGFELKQKFGPAMAIVAQDELNLWLAGPQSSAAQSMPDGSTPQPGGWNRFVLHVENLAELVNRLRIKNIRFRNDIVHGPGGSQILCEDPSGNVIELFQAK